MNTFAKSHAEEKKITVLFSFLKWHLAYQYEVRFHVVNKTVAESIFVTASELRHFRLLVAMLLF